MIPDRAPAFQTPIIKLTEHCNYICEFCRYANHPPEGSAVMEPSLCKQILRETALFNAEKGRRSETVIFHGGEPLLWGKERFREIYAYEKELEKETGISFRNNIQTNGFLIDEEWAELFSEMEMHPGISLDGPAEMNAHYGKDGNQASLERVIRNMALLREKGIRPGILSVVSEKSYGKAEAYFAFLEEAGIESAGFCLCYNPMDHCVAQPEALAQYLTECFDLYYHTKRRVRIREFDFALRAMYGKGSRGCVHNCRRECGNFLSYTPEGSVNFCDAYEKDTFVIGDLKEQSLKEILGTDVYASVKRLYQRPADEACRACEWREVCGCGCGRNDAGEGEARKSYFCETYQRLYSHILDTVRSDSRLAGANKRLINRYREI